MNERIVGFIGLLLLLLAFAISSFEEKPQEFAQQGICIQQEIND